MLDLGCDRDFFDFFNLWFNLTYGKAATGLPPGVEFSSAGFGRPSTPTVEGQLLHIKTSTADDHGVNISTITS